MAFSTLRKYDVQHGMNPTVAPSKGSGSTVSASAPAPAPGGGGNDGAALAGMGAVGAGLLGKFAYDKSKQDLIDQAYLKANPDNDVMRAAEGLDFSKTNMPNADVLGGLGVNSIVQDPSASELNPSVGSTVANIPGMLGRYIGKVVPDSWANFMDKNNWNPLTGIF